jgi:phosphoesterase RecJ-like protein
MTNSWSLLQPFLDNHQRVTLLIHEKPDGDCIGTALALGLFLKDLGLSPTLYHREELPTIYKFLPGQENFVLEARDALPEGVPVITVDCADLDRIVYTIPPGSPIFNLDHHISNTRFGNINLVDSTAAATGEIVYNLIRESGKEITADMATCLFVALATDTGSFQFSNTTARTFAIAGPFYRGALPLFLRRNRPAPPVQSLPQTCLLPVGGRTCPLGPDPVVQEPLPRRPGWWW